MRPYLEFTLADWSKSKSLAAFSGAALDSYRAQISDPDCVHAMCEDYRAGAAIERQHDAEDLAAGRKIQCPLHFVWSRHGFPARTGNPKALWSNWASNVTGTEIDAGHFPLEENPASILKAFVPIFQ